MISWWIALIPLMRATAVVVHSRVVSVDSGTLPMIISIGPDTEGKHHQSTPGLALTTHMETPLVSFVKFKITMRFGSCALL